jgi:SAM-dependent methyltransferase
MVRRSRKLCCSSFRILLLQFAHFHFQILEPVGASLEFHEYTSLKDYDQTIADHICMDACNASIVYRLLQGIGFDCAGKRVLDLGTGTGQVARLLGGIPGLIVEACDVDHEVAAYFKHDFELRSVSFYFCDFIKQELPKNYDAIIGRGIYHHLPKQARPTFLKAMATKSPVFILADEGIKEYSSEDERLSNCRRWYGLVIEEAKRRGFHNLVKIESQFLKHEQLRSADDGGDFKESPSHLIEDAAAVGLVPTYIDRYGPWHEFGGGFFTATFLK